MFWLFALVFTVSCATNSVKTDLEKKVQSQEARTLLEIREDTALILNRHPELRKVIKGQVQARIEASLKTHTELRKRESKLISLMLEHSLIPIKDLKASTLESEILSVYAEKGQNISGLIAAIRELTKEEHPDKDFIKEMGVLIREMR